MMLTSYLFIIRPIGVVSKNDIGDRRMLFNMALWRIPDALTILVSAKQNEVNINIPVKNL